MIEDYSKDWWEVFPHLAGPTGKLRQSNDITTEQKTEVFIYRAKQLHGSKYGYTKSIYVRALNKLVITCHEHGDFEQTPGHHLSGKGCARCAKVKKSNTLEFLLRAIELHKDKYNYQHVKYVSCDIPVTLECYTHGKWEQRPSNHLRGDGCPSCGGTEKGTNESFISKAKEVHSDRYQYSKVEYVNNCTPVEIICPTHGGFFQLPSGHLRGVGCAKCNGGVRDTKETFIAKAVESHEEGKYDYSEVEYINTDTPVSILCNTHGRFLQTPNVHVRGSGCPNCVGRSFGFLYLIQYQGSTFKIGITNNIKRRLAELKTKNKNISLVSSWKVADTFEVEQYLLNKYTTKPVDLGVFPGSTELRILTDGEVLEIKEYLEGLTNASI